MKNIVLVTTLIFMTACSKVGSNVESGWLRDPKAEYKEHAQDAGSLSFDFTPKAEIVFVIDNSKSMSHHIEKVSQNIDKFVEAFSRNNPLTYNLSVVSVYDTRTYLSKKYQDKWAATDSVFQLGQFRQVKSSPKEVVPNKYFISSGDENLPDLLRNTLKVGVQDLDAGGPQIEESFSPLAAIYGLSHKSVAPELAARQAPFFMGKDSYKIIFFVTDATDASDMSASELYYDLLAQAGHDKTKVMAFGAIVPSASNNCARDPGNRSYKLEEFLKLTSASEGATGSNVVSLCESFGEKFATFGKSIRDRTFTKIIPLEDTIPVINSNPEQTLRLFYGEQELPFETSSEKIGFRYDPESNSVHINPDVELVQQPGAKLRIVYTSAKPTK